MRPGLDRIARCWRPLTFPAVLGMCAAGCIVIPTPEFNSGSARANLGKQTPLAFEPGKTTRTEVILALGEPDAVSPDERQLAYRSQKVCGFWFVGAYYSGSGGAIEKDRYLVFDFDARGQLEKTERSAHWLTSADVAKVLPATASGEYGLTAEGICLRSCAKWFAHLNGFRDKHWEAVLGFPGELLLRPSNLVFISKAQFANAPPELAIAYASLRECRVDNYFLGRRLVVCTQAGEYHTFALQKSIGGAADKQATLAACDFIQSKMPRRSRE